MKRNSGTVPGKNHAPQSKRKFLLLAPLILILVAWGSNTNAQFLDETADLPRSQVLAIGRISDSPRKHYWRMKSMANYLAMRMADLGIKASRVVLARDEKQMMEYLRQGKVDLVTGNAFKALRYQRNVEAELFIHQWADGTPKYQSIFFARKNSEIQTLADLRGRVIAFEDISSTSGYQVPAATLLKAGLVLQPLASPREKPDDDKVGYVFADGERNVAVWVHKELVDAGALSNLDWIDKETLSDRHRSDLAIFERTDFYPRAIEVVRSDLPDEIKQRLREIKLQMHGDPTAADVLRDYQRTAKFEKMDEALHRQLADAASLLYVMEQLQEPN